MKKIVFLLLSLWLTVTAFAAEKQLSALFGYSAFYLPENNQPYVETYLNFNAWTLNLVADETGMYRATVEVTLVVRKNDTVAYVKKYELHSPYTASPDADQFTFFDLQRFALANGIYDMELTLRDKASNQPPFIMNDKLIVFYQNHKPSMSNIQLMSSATPTEQSNMLSRNGYDMVPYINDFIPADITELHPYIEVYNLDKELGNSAYSIYLSIQQKETGRRIPSYDNFIRRHAASSSDPIYTTIDISSLPSGNYDLVAEVRNLKGEALMKKTMSFQRSNPNVTNDEQAEDYVASSFAALITDQKLLNYYISALYPIASTHEASTAEKIVKGDNLAEKQAFFYRFWLKRDMLNPEGKWLEYQKLLQYVDEHFSYPKTPGYMTDRGRVYLQYGPPSFVRSEKNFVGALNLNAFGTVHYLPYELWRYDLLPNDSPNRVFLFWDEFRSGFYKLLNSNARGEIITPNWERVLSQNQLEENVQGEVGTQFERGF